MPPTPGDKSVTRVRWSQRDYHFLSCTYQVVTTTKGLVPDGWAHPPDKPSCHDYCVKLCDAFVAVDPSLLTEKCLQDAGGIVEGNRMWTEYMSLPTHGGEYSKSDMKLDLNSVALAAKAEHAAAAIEELKVYTAEVREMTHF